MIKIYKTKSKMKNSEVVKNSCKELIFLGFDRKGELEIIHYVIFLLINTNTFQLSSSPSTLCT